MTDIEMILSGHRACAGERVPINIDPAVRARLRDLLLLPELQGVGYSAFINRACEVAETAIMVRRSRGGM